MATPPTPNDNHGTDRDADRSDDPIRMSAPALPQRLLSEDLGIDLHEFLVSDINEEPELAAREAERLMARVDRYGLEEFREGVSITVWWAVERACNYLESISPTADDLYPRRPL